MAAIKSPAVETNSSSAVPGSLRRIMAQHPLLAFVIMAYAFSWIATIPYILWEWGKLPGTQNQFTLVFVIKAFVGPFLAAYIMTRITEGKAGWTRIRRSILQWRESWKMVAFIFIVFPLFILLVIVLMPGALASFAGFTIRDLVALAVSFILVTLGGGPLAEEPGWRGYALPLLLKRYGSSPYAALKASLLLGVIWTFWHLPDFLTSAQYGGPEAGLRPFYANLPIFFLLVMSLTIIFTWVFNRTNGSVFMAIMLHAVLNTLGVNIVPLFPIPAVAESDTAVMIACAALALLIIVLTRGKLGWEPGKEDPE